MSNKHGRTLIILLVCSVTVNLLLIGGIAGHFLSGPPGRPFPSHLGWITSELDNETREKIRPILKNFASNTRSLRSEMAEAQRDFEQAMTRDPMDEEEVNLALKKLQQSAEENQYYLHQQLIDIMKEIKPEQRRKALRYLHRRGPSHSRRKRGPDRPGRAP